MGRALCRYLTQKHLRFVAIEKNVDRIPIMKNASMQQKRSQIEYIIDLKTGDKLDYPPIKKSCLDYEKGKSKWFGFS